MEHKAKRIEKREYWNGCDWVSYPAYMRCVCETVEDEMECLYYKPATNEERLKMCHVAPEWHCVYNEAGCSDECTYKGGSE